MMTEAAYPLSEPPPLPSLSFGALVQKASLLKQAQLYEKTGKPTTWPVIWAAKWTNFLEQVGHLPDPIIVQEDFRMSGKM